MCQPSPLKKDLQYTGKRFRLLELKLCLNVEVSPTLPELKTGRGIDSRSPNRLLKSWQNQSARIEEFYNTLRGGACKASRCFHGPRTNAYCTPTSKSTGRRVYLFKSFLFQVPGPPRSSKSLCTNTRTRHQSSHSKLETMMCILAPA